jgi:hypothetical protein
MFHGTKCDDLDKLDINQLHLSKILNELALRGGYAAPQTVASVLFLA